MSSEIISYLTDVEERDAHVFSVQPENEGLVIVLINDLDYEGFRKPAWSTEIKPAIDEPGDWRPWDWQFTG